MHINLLISNFASIPQWKDIFRMSICLSFYIGIWTISLQKNDRTSVLMLSCSHILYISYMGHGLLSITFARVVQNLNVVIFNSSHAFSLYILTDLLKYYLGGLGSAKDFYMSITFAILWIIFWGWVFDILDDPSGAQILGFIIIGLGGPIVSLFRRR